MPMAVIMQGTGGSYPEWGVDLTDGFLINTVFHGISGKPPLIPKNNQTIKLHPLDKQNSIAIAGFL